jgi:hypothetical protein
MYLLGSALAATAFQLALAVKWPLVELLLLLVMLMMLMICVVMTF